MIDIIQSEIENTTYAGVDRVELLRQLIGAAAVVFEDKQYEEYRNAATTLRSIQPPPGSSPSETFSFLKTHALLVIDQLIRDVARAGLQEPDNFSAVLRGQQAIDVEERLKFYLLVIEQKHIAYFRERPGKFNGEAHDRLHHYHWTLTSHGKITFGFHAGMGLDPGIETDAANAAKAAFDSFRIA